MFPSCFYRDCKPDQVPGKKGKRQPVTYKFKYPLYHDMLHILWKLNVHKIFIQAVFSSFVEVKRPQIVGFYLFILSVIGSLFIDHAWLLIGYICVTIYYYGAGHGTKEQRINGAHQSF